MKSIFLLICTMLLFTCNGATDQVTHEYSTYTHAQQEGLFQQELIPFDFIRQDMTDIYVRYNTNLKSCIFASKTSQLPLPYKDGLKIQTDLIKIEGIDIPDWWNKGVLNNYGASLQINHSEVVNVVINFDNGLVFGWYENDRR